MTRLPAMTRQGHVHPDDEQCLRMLLRVPEGENLPKHVVESALELQRWAHVLGQTGRLDHTLLILACIRAGHEPPEPDEPQPQLPRDPATDLYEEPVESPAPGRPLTSNHVLVGGRYYYVRRDGDWLEAAFVRKGADENYEFRPADSQETIQVAPGEIREMD